MNVVLLHAFPLDERMWDPQLPALVGHDVAAPNLYDLGGSSIDAWAQQILDEVEGELVVVGASMGGYVALSMARKAPDRVRALLLAGSRAGVDSAERRAVREEMIHVIREGGVAGWNAEFSPKAPTDRTPDELIRATEALRDRPDASPVVASFVGPFVLVVGDQDELLPVEEGREITDSAPDGRLEVIEGIGHFVSVEAPERFNQILLELLRRAR